MPTARRLTRGGKVEYSVGVGWEGCIPCEQNDRFKNIIFPATSFAGGKNKISENVKKIFAFELEFLFWYFINIRMKLRLRKTSRYFSLKNKNAFQ